LLPVKANPTARISKSVSAGTGRPKKNTTPTANTQLRELRKGMPPLPCRKRQKDLI
jgi:hypothetical protein